MAFYADKHELFDGDILLYRRQSPNGDVHPVWQARLKVAGRVGYVTKSCRTKNYDDARAFAKEQLFTLQHKVKNGIPVKDWTFEAHWQDWYDRHISRGTWRDARQKWHLNYFKRYFAPYFGDKILSAITAEFADGYWGWRIGYWGRDEGRKLQTYNPRRQHAKGRGTLNFTHHPSNKTLLMEQSALNQIFADASQLRRIQFLVKLKAPRPNRSDGRRPAFDGDEWEALTSHLHEWADGLGRYARHRLNAYHRLQRQQLRAYVLFLASSGVRVGEARKMRWEDISDLKLPTGGHTYLQIRVREDTKTGSRTAIPMPSARSCLSEWFFLSEKPRPQALVWRGQKTGADDGEYQAATDLNKTFQKFLRGIPYQGRKDGMLRDTPMGGPVRFIHCGTPMPLQHSCTASPNLKSLAIWERVSRTYRSTTVT